MSFDYYFPLFEDVLNGKLNPLLPDNADGNGYMLRLQEQVVAQASDKGIYRLRFQKPFNLKTRYYQQKILSETFLYIEELLEFLNAETNRQIRTYLRDQILDKHLSTCLIRLGEKLRAEKLFTLVTDKPDAGTTADDLSNAYVFQLLKVCVAKAYLEVQQVLADVIAHRQSEEWLYTSLVGEMPPVKCCLYPGAATVAPAQSPLSTTKTAQLPVEETYYDSKQVRVLLNNCSESTLNRYKKSDTFPKARKVGRKDLYAKREVDAWLAKTRL